jgi:predicted lactoylglutathione lyase
MRQIFVNLPVRDLTVAAEFFRALGFAADEPSPDGTAVQLTLGADARLMLHTRPAFEAYTGVPVTDPATSREVIVGLAVESREQVDDLHDRAVAAGGGSLGPGADQGWLYMRGFRDPDGHQWSFLSLGG